MKTRTTARVLALAILITAFASLLSAGPAAATDIGWQPAAPLVSDAPQNAYLGDLSVSGGGTGMLVWTRTGAHTDVYATRFVPGAGAGGTNWEVPERISMGPYGAYGPSVGTDVSGNSVAAWYEWTNQKGYAIHAASFRAGVGWGAPLRIDQNSGQSYTPNVGMSSAGNAFVAWQAYPGARYDIYAARYVSGVGWGAPTLLDNNNVGSALYPRVGADSVGNGFVVWQEYDGTRYNIVTTRFSGGAWSVPTPLEASTQNTADPDIAVDSSGNALVAWRQWDGVRWNIWANIYTFGVGWGGATNIEASANSAAYGGRPGVAMSNGRAIVAWQMYDGMQYSIYANRNPGAGWTGEVQVDGVSQYAEQATVAIDQNGDALVAYLYYDSTFTSANRLAVHFDAASSTWDSFGYLEFNQQVSYPTFLEMDNAGNALAAWTRDEDPLDTFRQGITSLRYLVASGWMGYWLAEPVEFDQQMSVNFVGLAVNDAGAAVAAWVQDDGPVWNVYAAVYNPSGGWTVPTRIEDMDFGDATEVDVAIDGTGNGYAIFRIWDGLEWGVYASRYSPMTLWSAPVRVDVLAGVVWWLRLAGSPTGGAIAVWQQWDGANWNLYASRFDIGTMVWQMPVTLESLPGDAYGCEIGIDGSGNAIVVWSQWDGSAYSAFANHFFPGMGWSGAFVIEGTALGSGSVMVGVSGTGYAMAAWPVWTGTQWDVYASRYDPSVGWGGEFALESGPTDGGVRSPAIDDAGNALLAWYVWGNGAWDAYVTEYVAGVGWGSTRPLENSPGDAPNPFLSMDHRGNAFAVWQQWNGARYDVVGRRYVAGQGWGSPTLLDTNDEAVDYQQVYVDGAGNAFAIWRQFRGNMNSPWTARYVIGDGAPTLVLTSPVEGLTGDPAIVVQGTTDPGATVTVDGSPVAVAKDGSFVTVLLGSEGLNTVTVVARNAAGVTRTQTRSVTIDTTPPNVLITSPASGTLTNDAVAHVWGSTEPGVDVVVNGVRVDVTSAGVFEVLLPLVEGDNDIAALATDAVGNWRRTSIVVTLDTTAPLLTLTSPTAQVTNNPNVIVGGQTEPGASVTVDSTSVFVDPSGTFNYGVALPDGPHTFTVVATDGAGNSVTRTVDIVIDTSAPTLVITSPPGSTVLTRDPLLSIFGTTDPDAEVVVNGIVGDVDVNGNFAVRLTLREGFTAVRVDAIDPAGNVATTTISVTVDMTPPELALGAPADGTITNDPTVLVSGLTEAGVTLTIDGSPVPVGPAGTFSTTVTLPEGTHLFDVIATDAVGNVARAHAVVEVDTTAPLVTISSPGDGSATANPTIVVTGSAEPGSHVVLNGYDVAVDSSGGFSVRLALRPGANGIAAEATDAAGNVATDAITVTFNDPVPGLRQELNDTRDDLADTNANLNDTVDALDETNTQLQGTRVELGALSTQTLLLLVLLVVSLVLGIFQFVQMRKLQGRQGPQPGREDKEAPPPPTQ